MAAYLLISVNCTGRLYRRRCFGILQFYNCLAILYKIIGLQFFTCNLLSVLLFYAFVTRISPSQSLMIFYYSQLWEHMFKKSVIVFTARISGDCNQTWPGSGNKEIFKRLWQTRGLEHKVQLWPILSCVIRRLLCPKICH